MFYQLYELNHAAMRPLRIAAEMGHMAFSNPFNPWASTSLGRSVAATFEVIERTTRRYGKPSFDLPVTTVDGREVPVTEKVVWRRPFCHLLHFERDLPAKRPADPKVLIVAPMSGHYATLLRGTVEAMLPAHEVYITDWVDARMVPVTEGGFDLDDYVDYIVEMIHHLGEGVNIIAVCQPSVPVLAAVALMNEDRDPLAPATMTLMGGPLDTRISPTAVNKVAHTKGMAWFLRPQRLLEEVRHDGLAARVRDRPAALRAADAEAPAELPHLGRLDPAARGARRAARGGPGRGADGRRLRRAAPLPPRAAEIGRAHV
jgi:poly(3-hydroxybutyrate) depolymerase